VRDGSRIVEDPFTRLRLAEAAAEIGTAHDRMLALFAQVIRRAGAGEEIPLSERARWRWNAAKATDWAVRAVDTSFAASSGRGIFLANPIQRAWRDARDARTCRQQPRARRRRLRPLRIRPAADRHPDLRHRANLIAATPRRD
jgi:alkylation response protein AidB-like acyl-CoA dehydrogenase